ncbi:MULTISPECIES: carbon-nitrogen family hydrolase [Priestia]|uniref:carbon-nitrogen family hydrolase n=1 Tax=Priestia TaxID=2800373 RepID=UPI001C8E3DF7|nr:MULTISPECIES: carbon-nitrogen family hydrolase [Priestia]MBY0061340.1 carbon-nitrogen family hydrolase [Priestia aryabhattai]MDN3361870.1 carbon-nitrogen family hydrolase [Priestia megaterium]WKU22124.1 carbon-nitrogen family hydrolase [Priestia megaterium]
MKVQLFQMEIIEEEVKQNENRIECLFEEKLDADTEIVVIPEMWNTGYDLKNVAEKSDIDLKRTFSFIQSLAIKHQVNIIAGSVSNKRYNNIYNTAFAVSKAGELLYQKDKIHLVPMLDEHHYLTGGDEVPEVFEINGIKASQIICYDLRFPEITRYPASQGAKIIFYVAQWTTKNIDHWKTLLKARAIENGVYVIACNSVGKVNHKNHAGNTYAGHSMIIEPNGNIVEEGRDQEEIITAEIHIQKVTEQQKSIPIFKNLRPNVYKHAE